MWIARSQMALALGLVLVCGIGCKRLHRIPGLKAHRSLSAPRILAPLTGSPREQLELSQFDSSSVVVPVGTRRARPVIIAIHGQSDSPEVDCNAWSTIANNSYFVLCPSLRSKATGPDKPAQACTQWECTVAELKEALVALRKRFGPYVASKQVALAGFDGGASLVVPIAQQDPSVFSVVWLIDGGMQAWSTALSTSFVDRGGKLLGVVCTNPSCQSDLTRIVASARATGLAVAEYHAARPERDFNLAFANALKSTWETSRPRKWPWIVPGERKVAKH